MKINISLKVKNSAKFSGVFVAGTEKQINGKCFRLYMNAIHFQNNRRLRRCAA